MYTPLHPLLYSRTGVYSGIHFFLVLFYNIDSGYLLEPPQNTRFISKTLFLRVGVGEEDNNNNNNDNNDNNV